MTNKEAIEKLKEDCEQTIAECECKDGKCLCHIHKAIEALEKQIPKKPIKWADKILICPNCARAEYIKKIDILDTYCGFCGQAIDWSEVE